MIQITFKSVFSWLFRRQPLRPGVTDDSVAVLTPGNAALPEQKAPPKKKLPAKADAYCLDIASDRAQPSGEVRFTASIYYPAEFDATCALITLLRDATLSVQESQDRGTGSSDLSTLTSTLLKQKPDASSTVRYFMGLLTSLRVTDVGPMLPEDVSGGCHLKFIFVGRLLDPTSVSAEIMEKDWRITLTPQPMTEDERAELRRPMFNWIGTGYDLVKPVVISPETVAEWTKTMFPHWSPSDEIRPPAEIQAEVKRIKEMVGEYQVNTPGQPPKIHVVAA